MSHIETGPRRLGPSIALWGHHRMTGVTASCSELREGPVLGHVCVEHVLMKGEGCILKEW